MVHSSTPPTGIRRSDGTAVKRLVAFLASASAVVALGWLVLQKLGAGEASVVDAGTRVRFVRMSASDSRPIDLQELEKTLHAPEHLAAAAEKLGVSSDQAGQYAEHLAGLLEVQFDASGKLAEVVLALPSDCGLGTAHRAEYLEQLGREVLAAERREQVNSASSAHGAVLARLQSARRHVARLKAQFETQLEKYLSQPAPAVTQPEPIAPSAPVVFEAQRQLDALYLKRESMLERLTPQHPDVIELDEEIRLREATLPPPSESRTVQTSPTPRGIHATPSAPADALARQLRDTHQSLNAAERECDELAQSERDAWRKLEQARLASWQLVPASPPGFSSAKISAGRGISLVCLLAVVIGGLAAGYVSGPGTSYRQAADLQHHLGVPVLGVLPAENHQ